MENEILMDDKNILVMKLLHYFIIDKNYNPIILQGVENEIWLENLEEDYKVVRIVSNYIHNDEQFNFDVFKTKRIVKKIKKKTLSFHMNTLSIFLDMGENVSQDIHAIPNVECVKINTEADFKNSDVIKREFPDLTKKLKFNEKGIALFAKITSDINEHNKKDAKKINAVFKNNFPMITYWLIAVNVILYVIPVLFGLYDDLIANFSVWGPAIREGQTYRLLTGIFLHGGFVHLLFNCYALYVIGSQVENFLGRIKFLIIYLVAGVSGALFSMIFGNYASVGASGAIFGLMGALVYFGYHYRVYLGNVVKSQIIPLILLNLFLGFMMSGVDNFAHIGGLIGGSLMAIALGVKDKSSWFERINGWIITGIFLAFSIYMAFIYIA
ncbi:MAG: rhomboid family intramembrane serine protease [bacterium]|nr:rhomboid family intramembrane serine protease [Mycoplasmatota bacterium]MDD6757637.1 rhomboid family intramembrane serine protease [bacterium]MDY2908677.1 rhomboid family intramembrane serine protease [Candidatus Faecimonas sp.]